MADQLANFAYCTLTSAVNDSTTTFAVDELSRIPPLGGFWGDFWMTVESTYAQGAFEIVKVTGKSGSSGPGTLTVVRGQDDTSAVPHPAGMFLKASLTKGIIQRIYQYISSTLTAFVADLPTPDDSQRGKQVLLMSDGTTADTLYVCLAKTYGTEYEWVQLAQGGTGTIPTPPTPTGIDVSTTETSITVLDVIPGDGPACTQYVVFLMDPTFTNTMDAPVIAEPTDSPIATFSGLTGNTPYGIQVVPVIASAAGDPFEQVVTTEASAGALQDPTYVGGSVFSDAGSGESNVVAWPSGIEDGDLALLAYEVYVGGNQTAIPGFTQIGSAITGGAGGGYDGVLTLWQHTCDGTESGNLTFDGSINSDHCIHLRVYRHAELGDVVSGTDTDLSASTPTQSVVAHDRVLSIYGVYRNTGSTVSWTPDGSFVNVMSNWASSFSAMLTADDAPASVDGTSATRTTTIGSVGQPSWSIASVVLHGVAVEGGTPPDPLPYINYSSTPNSLTAEWDPVTTGSPLPDSYLVFLMDDSASSTLQGPVSVTADDTTMSHTFTGLAVNTGYTLRVLSEAGGAYSAPFDQVAYTDAVQPGPPTDLAVDPSGTSAVVTWTDPVELGDPAITEYFCYVVANPNMGEGWVAWEGVAFGLNTWTMTGLAVSTDYTVSIASEGANGQNHEATLNFTTAASDEGGGDTSASRTTTSGNPSGIGTVNAAIRLTGTPTFVTSGVRQINGGSTSITPGGAAGDLSILAFAAYPGNEPGGTNGYTAPSGWTLATTIDGVSGFGLRLVIFTKTLTGSEGSPSMNIAGTALFYTYSGATLNHIEPGQGDATVAQTVTDGDVILSIWAESYNSSDVTFGFDGALGNTQSITNSNHYAIGAGDEIIAVSGGGSGISDDFNRADANPDSGIFTPLGSSSWRVEGNRLRCNGGGGPNLGGPHAVVECGSKEGTITWTPVAGGNPPGLVFRYTDDANCILWLSSGLVTQLIGGSEIVLLGNGAVPFANGDVVQAVMEGDNLTVKVNGTALYSAVAMNLTTGTKHGPFFQGSGTDALDGWSYTSATA